MGRETIRFFGELMIISDPNATLPRRNFSLPASLASLDSLRDGPVPSRQLSSTSLDGHLRRRVGDAVENNLVLAALMATEIEFESRSATSSFRSGHSGGGSASSSEADASDDWERTQHSPKRAKSGGELPFVAETPSFADMF